MILILYSLSSVICNFIILFSYRLAVSDEHGQIEKEKNCEEIKASCAQIQDSLRMQTVHRGTAVLLPM